MVFPQYSGGKLITCDGAERGKKRGDPRAEMVWACPQYVRVDDAMRDLDTNNPI